MNDRASERANEHNPLKRQNRYYREMENCVPSVDSIDVYTYVHARVCRDDRSNVRPGRVPGRDREKRKVEHKLTRGRARLHRDKPYLTP